jgi:hypothetical protein
MNIFSTDYWNTLSSQAADGQFGFTAFFNSFTSGWNEARDEKINVFVESSGKQLQVLLPLIEGIQRFSFLMYPVGCCWNKTFFQPIQKLISVI